MMRFQDGMVSMENAPKVAALYLRLSKEDMDKMSKGDDSESIKNQRLLLTDEALNRGFIIGDVYSDDDYSGTDSSRPEFNRLIEDAKLKKFNIVLCKSQSRFTRDMEAAEKYINRVFPLLGIRFISVIDHVDTDVKGNKKARQINALINEWYVEDLSENIKAVYRSKTQQGQYLGAFALYGYIKDKKDKHRIMIDEEAAEVVRKIYCYYLEGNGIQAICCKLQEEKILPPMLYKQSKGMKFHTPFQEYAVEKHLWSATTIRRILRSEMYIGTMVQGKERKVSYKSKKMVQVPEDEWIKVENTHEPIISKEDFYKVQEMMQYRRRTFSGTEQKRKPHALAGKVFCKDCESTMVRSGMKNKKDNYLRCRLANRTALKECSGHGIKYAVLEESVLEELQGHINEVLQDTDIYEDIINNIKQTDDPAEKLENRYKSILAEKLKLETALKNCCMDKYSGDLDETMFLELKIDIDKKMKQNQTELEELELKRQSWKTAGSSKEQAERLLEKYKDFTILTHELVYDFIKKVEIGEKDENKEQEIIIHWNF